MNEKEGFEAWKENNILLVLNIEFPSTSEWQVQQDKIQDAPRLELEEMVNKVINYIKNEAAGSTEVVKMIRVAGPVFLLWWRK